MRVIGVLTNMIHEKRLSEFGLISLQKKRLKGEGGNSLPVYKRLLQGKRQ